MGNSDNIIQWDQRLDWNISAKDQSYVRYSYLHEIKTNGLPLGPILDGSGYGGQYDTNLAMNFMGSETHIFNPSLTNEFRFGYNWGVFNFQQPNAYNPTLDTFAGAGAAAVRFIARASRVAAGLCQRHDPAVGFDSVSAGNRRMSTRSWTT